MWLKRVILILACFLCLALLLPLSGIASSYPEKSVQIIIGYAAGGSTDVMARIIAPMLEDILGQRFLVINKPGAGSEIGYTFTAQSKPDGYLIGNCNIPGFVTTYIQRPEAKFRLEDFSPIANIVNDPGILVVRSDSEFKTLEDYVNYAKENAGVVTASFEGLGTDGFIALREVEIKAEIELNRVMFTGDATARAALLGGHISSCFINVSEAVPMIKDGKARALAVMTKERTAALPDTPTFKELGYDIVSGSSRGFIGPKGFPEEYRTILIDALTEIVESEEFINKMEELTMPLEFVSGDDYFKLIKASEEAIRNLWEKEPWIK